MVILLVLVEVGSEVIDTSRQDRSLDRSAPNVSVVQLMLLDNFCSTDCHVLIVMFLSPPRESTLQGKLFRRITNSYLR